MIPSVNILSVYISDFVGCLLLLSIIITNGWKIPARKQESRILLFLIVATLFNCLLDPFGFYFDSKPGVLSHFGLFTVNTILYLYNLIVGFGVVFLVSYHLHRKITLPQKLVVGFMIVTEVLLLTINFFVPLVFSIDDNNVYRRGPCYMIFVLFGFTLIIYSWIIYAVERLKKGSLRYFPVWQFMLPAMICIVIQTVFYGISTQPVGFAVSFVTIVISLQNESLYIDKLTGTFNRFELDKIIETLKKNKMRKNRTVAAIMLDLNDFKSINDSFSHSEGDAALIALAKILTDVVQNRGVVIRFAGDEFIIVINKPEINIVPHLIEEINAAIDEFNQRSEKPYALSVAIGGDIFEMSGDNDVDFLKRIDELMYINKSEYYKTHDRRGHRHFSEPLS